MIRRPRTTFLLFVFLTAAVAAPIALPAPAARESAREADPAGLLHSTFSICAVDQESGESGVAVTTRVPFVGRAVPWVREIGRAHV